MRRRSSFVDGTDAGAEAAAATGASFAAVDDEPGAGLPLPLAGVPGPGLRRPLEMKNPARIAARTMMPMMKKGAWSLT